MRLWRGEKKGSRGSRREVRRDCTESREERGIWEKGWRVE
jgi:hypothetical protein